MKKYKNSRFNISKDKTKARIIKATLQLIWKYGFQGATTKKIADAAGVNEVTIFRKFKNKENLIAETYNTADLKMYPLKNFLKKDFSTVEEFLNEFGLMIFKQFLKNKESHLLCLKEIGNKDLNFVKTHIKSIRIIIDLVNEKFYKMHKQGKIKKEFINNIANIYHSSTLAVFIWHCVNNKETSNADIKNFIKSLSKILTHGIK
jgi:AcrR family transcriptional regulator